MGRPHYCWKVSLTYACGCVTTSPTTHVCGPARDGCNAWLTHKRTDKMCEVHRGEEGWSLTSCSPPLSSSSSSSATDDGGGGGVAGGVGDAGYGGRDGVVFEGAVLASASTTAGVVGGEGWGQGAATAAAEGGLVAGEGETGGKRVIQGEGSWEGGYARQRG
ncbi:hypothetical protein C8A05DRAFT_12509 [Staphylotrichum tortipilum]|uniref:Uncharacterized protein n=1 Tax=Staphylotrichum tortipilum TaxID=2831512 RepID=A0AAN6RX56_9PEZI|nr:hypothetical protein C8A05DRAFT_12509 [Staphylotrichum longicolle]